MIEKIRFNCLYAKSQGLRCSRPKTCKNSNLLYLKTTPLALFEQCDYFAFPFYHDLKNDCLAMDCFSYKKEHDKYKKHVNCSRFYHPLDDVRVACSCVGICTHMCRFNRIAFNL